jgi:hypothetical protein
MFNRPARTSRFANLSMAVWRVELVSGGAFRPQSGHLRFHLLDPATGTRRFAGRLGAVGDAVDLKPGSVYAVELYAQDGAFLRFFRMMDARGRGGSLRFFMEGEGHLVPRLYDGNLAGAAAAQPFRQVEPGLLEITRNCW